MLKEQNVNMIEGTSGPWTVLAPSSCIAGEEVHIQVQYAHHNQEEAGEIPSHLVISFEEQEEKTHIPVPVDPANDAGYTANEQDLYSYKVKKSSVLGANVTNYDVNYNIKRAGTWNVMLVDTGISSLPVKVLPGQVSARSSTVRGLGLGRVTGNNFAYFYITARDLYGNALDVGGSDVTVVITSHSTVMGSVIDGGEGFYEVVYALATVEEGGEGAAAAAAEGSQQLFMNRLPVTRQRSSKFVYRIIDKKLQDTSEWQEDEFELKEGSLRVAGGLVMSLKSSCIISERQDLVQAAAGALGGRQISSGGSVLEVEFPRFTIQALVPSEEDLKRWLVLLKAEVASQEEAVQQKQLRRMALPPGSVSWNPRHHVEIHIEVNGQDINGSPWRPAIVASESKDEQGNQQGEPGSTSQSLIDHPESPQMRQQPPPSPVECLQAGHSSSVLHYKPSASLSMHGLLYKRGGLSPRLGGQQPFRRRYFLLVNKPSPPRLLYFLKPFNDIKAWQGQAQRARDTMLVEGAVIEIGPPPTVNLTLSLRVPGYPFKILFPSNDFSDSPPIIYELEAQSEKERDEWITALQAAGAALADSTNDLEEAEPVPLQGGDVTFVLGAPDMPLSQDEFATAFWREQEKEEEEESFLITDEGMPILPDPEGGQNDPSGLSEAVPSLRETPPPPPPLEEEYTLASSPPPHLEQTDQSSQLVSLEHAKLVPIPPNWASVADIQKSQQRQIAYLLDFLGKLRRGLVHLVGRAENDYGQDQLVINAPTKALILDADRWLNALDRWARSPSDPAEARMLQHRLAASTLVERHAACEMLDRLYHLHIRERRYTPGSPTFESKLETPPPRNEDFRRPSIIGRISIPEPFLPVAPSSPLLMHVKRGTKPKLDIDTRQARILETKAKSPTAAMKKSPTAMKRFTGGGTLMNFEEANSFGSTTYQKPDEFSATARLPRKSKVPIQKRMASTGILPKKMASTRRSTSLRQTTRRPEWRGPNDKHRPMGPTSRDEVMKHLEKAGRIIDEGSRHEANGKPIRGRRHERKSSGGEPYGIIYSVLLDEMSSADIAKDSASLGIKKEGERQDFSDRKASSFSASAFSPTGSGHTHKLGLSSLGTGQSEANSRDRIEGTLASSNKGEDGNNDIKDNDQPIRAARRRSSEGGQESAEISALDSPSRRHQYLRARSTGMESKEWGDWDWDWERERRMFPSSSRTFTGQHFEFDANDRDRHGRRGNRRRTYGYDRGVSTGTLRGKQKTRPPWRGGGVTDDPVPKDGRRLRQTTVRHQRAHTTMPFMISKRARDAGYYSSNRSMTARSTTSSMDHQRGYDSDVTRKPMVPKTPFQALFEYELKTKIGLVSDAQEGRWKSPFRDAPSTGTSFFDLYSKENAQNAAAAEAVAATSPKSVSTTTSSPRRSPSFYRTGVSLPDYYHKLPDTGDDDAFAVTENDEIAKKLQPPGLAERAEWNRLVEWLKGLNMHKYVPLFHSQGLTKLASLELLELEDLEDIGIHEADRLPLLNAIQVFSLRTREWTDTALAQTYQSHQRSHTANPLPPAWLCAPSPYEIMKAFDNHDYSSLLLLWDRILPYEAKRPGAPATALAQALEFYLRIYVAIGPIIRDRPMLERLDAMARFRRYIEYKASSLPLAKTERFVAYASLHQVPQPHMVPDYAALFDPSWTSALRERLRLFLQAISHIPPTSPGSTTSVRKHKTRRSTSEMSLASSAGSPTTSILSKDGSTPRSATATSSPTRSCPSRSPRPTRNIDRTDAATAVTSSTSSKHSKMRLAMPSPKVKSDPARSENKDGTPRSTFQPKSPPSQSRHGRKSRTKDEQPTREASHPLVVGVRSPVSSPSDRNMAISSTQEKSRYLNLQSKAGSYDEFRTPKSKRGQNRTEGNSPARFTPDGPVASVRPASSYKTSASTQLRSIKSPVDKKQTNSSVASPPRPSERPFLDDGRWPSTYNNTALSPKMAERPATQSRKRGDSFYLEGNFEEIQPSKEHMKDDGKRRRSPNHPRRPSRVAPRPPSPASPSTAPTKARSPEQTSSPLKDSAYMSKTDSASLRRPSDGGRDEVSSFGIQHASSSDLGTTDDPLLAVVDRPADQEMQSLMQETTGQHDLVPFTRHDSSAGVDYSVEEPYATTERKMRTSQAPQLAVSPSRFALMSSEPIIIRSSNLVVSPLTSPYTPRLDSHASVQSTNLADSDVGSSVTDGESFGLQAFATHRLRNVISSPRVPSSTELPSGRTVSIADDDHSSVGDALPPPTPQSISAKSSVFLTPATSPSQLQAALTRGFSSTSSSPSTSPSTSPPGSPKAFNSEAVVTVSQSVDREAQSPSRDATAGEGVTQKLAKLLGFTSPTPVTSATTTTTIRLEDTMSATSSPPMDRTTSSLGADSGSLVIGEEEKEGDEEVLLTVRLKKNKKKGKKGGREGRHHFSLNPEAASSGEMSTSLSSTASEVLSPGT